MKRWTFFWPCCMQLLGSELQGKTTPSRKETYRFASYTPMAGVFQNSRAGLGFRMPEFIRSSTDVGTDAMRDDDEKGVYHVFEI